MTDRPARDEDRKSDDRRSPDSARPDLRSAAGNPEIEQDDLERERAKLDRVIGK